MTCTCKAELASIRSAIVEDVLAAAELCRTSGNKSGADAMDFLAGRISRPPSPAPAEPQEPLTGWREKCEIASNGSEGWYVMCRRKYENDWYLRDDGRWINRAPYTDLYFPTESAARAALLDASEPGVAASLSECRTLTEATRYCMEHPEPTKPAPAPFDAAKLAEKMVKPIVADGLAGLHELDGGGYCAFYQDDSSNQARINHARQIIAAALRAAHSAGKAEAGQPRLRYEVLNAKKEAIAAFRDHYSATVFCNGLDGRSVVDTQPAPPAEKEGTR